MKNTLAPILAILDDGLRLYRRWFVTFAALAAIGAVPLVILFVGGGLVSALIEPAYGTLITFAGFVLGLPAMIYAVSAVSRATAVARGGGQPALRDALAIGPGRAVGMGCYGSILLVGMNIAASMVSLVCICPLYIAVAGSFGVMSALFVGGGDGPGAAAAGLFIALGALALVLIYLLSLAVSGAAYCGAVFSLQPFVHERGRFSAAMSRSVDLLAYRFGANLLAFICASLVFGAISVATALAVGVLGPLPLLIALGAESPVTQVAFGAAWVLGAVLAAPPLPIWMALLYERRLAEREGGDLGERIAALVGPAL
jgi:hypothetical protein